MLVEFKEFIAKSLTGSAAVSQSLKQLIHNEISIRRQHLTCKVVTATAVLGYSL